MPNFRLLLFETFNLREQFRPSQPSVYSLMPFGRFSVTLTNQLLTYGSPASGLIKFCDSDSGRYEDRLEVTLEDERLQQRFVIVRPLRAIIGDREDHALLKPKAPFVPRELAAREPETEVFKGVLPPSLKAIPYVVTLPWAEIPRNLAASLWTGSLSEVIGRVRRGFLPPTWDSHTYGRHFKSLLWVEEYRMECVYCRKLLIIMHSPKI